MTFPKFLAFLLLATCAYVAQAAPWPTHARHATHRVRHIGRRAVQLNTFHPKSIYRIFGSEGIAQNATGSFAGAALNDSALSFVQPQLSIDPSQVSYRSGFDGVGGKFAYVRQAHEGVPFANAVANIAWKDNKVVAFGSSFVGTNNIAPSKPSLDVNAVIPAVEEALDAQFNGQNPSLEYLAQQDGSVALAHVIQIRNEEQGTWLEAFVCAHTGKILSVTDFVADASYTVLPIEKKAFPEGQEMLENPQDLLSSPFGWHSDGITNTTNTTGNNVAASIAGVTFANQTSDGPSFNTTYDDNFDPTNSSNMNAAITNAFYIINTVHDFSYRYGFTEKAFNFQNNNFGKGGEGGDSVLMSVQDSSGLNNANFATPPDGQSGVCRMFIWDKTNPRRDGSLENDIIIHEERISKQTFVLSQMNMRHTPDWPLIED